MLHAAHGDSHSSTAIDPVLWSDSCGCMSNHHLGGSFTQAPLGSFLRRGPAKASSSESSSSRSRLIPVTGTAPFRAVFLAS